MLERAREWVEQSGVPADPEWIDCLHGRGRLSEWLLSIDEPELWQEPLLAAAPLPRLHAIGYWYSWNEPDLPVPIAAKPRCDRRTKEAVLAHLRRGEVWMAFAGYSHCRRCKRSDGTMGSCDVTDGVWIWPEGLAHYIEEHDIELPAAFLDHATGGSTIDQRRLALVRVLNASISLERWLTWARDVGAIRRAWLPRAAARILRMGSGILQPSATAAKRWYVTSHETRGPFTEDEVRAMIRSGQIKPYHRLWKLGVGPERKARDMPGFVELCKTIPPEPI